MRLLASVFPLRLCVLCVLCGHAFIGTVLVMFIPTGAFDVIPRGGLVALRTLVDSRVWLASDASRNHLEVHHVVAGRRLVALGAVHRIGGRMSKFREGPLVCGMTLCAILTKQFEMAIVVGMAGPAVKRCLGDCNAMMRRSLMFGPHENFLTQDFIFAVGCVAVQLPQPDLGQRFVVHVGRTIIDALVLQMTLCATTDASVKRSRLPLQNRLVVGVADDALRRFDATDRRMASGTIVFEVSVSRRQSTRFGHPLPGGRLLERRFRGR